MPLRTSSKDISDNSDEELTSSIRIEGLPIKKSTILSFNSISKVQMELPKDSAANKASQSTNKPSNRFDKYKEGLKRDTREEYETPHDRDSKAILVKKIKLNEKLTGNEDIYIGSNYYKSYLSKEDTISGNATSQKHK